MFTGIIETTGIIIKAEKENQLAHFTIQSSISSELNVDQSVSHDGVCLTVTATGQNTHRVTAVEETLSKTNLSEWSAGKTVNLERAIKLGDRLDGHIVQGHVDTYARCIKVIPNAGNRLFRFEFDPSFAPLIVEKGSVCVNGVSLTAFDVTTNMFMVTIIPYTYTHTTFEKLAAGMSVNIEFDFIGKYLLRNMQLQQS